MAYDDRSSLSELAKMASETISIDVVEEQRATKPTWEVVRIPTEDLVDITAELYPAKGIVRGCIVLFHRSGGSRGEYRSIAPDLAARGFQALAVDLRWGRKDKSTDIVNETARRAGSLPVFRHAQREKWIPLRLEAQKDMATAIEWLRARPGCSDRMLIWGSSLTAHWVLNFVADDPEDYVGVISFSPGEYSPEDPDQMKNKVRNLTVPTYITWGRGEEELAKPIYDVISSGSKAHHSSKIGFHGTSILLDDTLAWEPLFEFLESVAKE